MVGGERWRERLQGDRERLALSLGLTVEELLIAQGKSYFFQLVQYVELYGGSWAEHEPGFVARGALVELSGGMMLIDPGAWFED